VKHGPDQGKVSNLKKARMMRFALGIIGLSSGFSMHIKETRIG
jgi:hypothetical protein